MNPFAIKSFLLCALFLGSLCAGAEAGQLPSPTCEGGRAAAPKGAWRWPQGTTVTVLSLRGAFSASELEALRWAVSDWDSAMSGTGIRLKFGGESDGVGNLPGSVTVTRVAVFENGRHLAEVSAFFEPDSSSRLRWAVVRIDPRVKDPEQLLSVFAHELGHTLGLDDCPKCAQGTTIMARYGGLRKGNGRVQPSGCDVRLARSLYADPPETFSAANGGER